MSISKTTRKAYAEVEEFFKLLDKKTIEKIPENVRNIFSEEKDIDYSKKIYSNIPIEEQNLMEETLAIIAYLNLEYMCEDEKEKERLREIYKRNEEKYKEIFQVGFDEGVVFEKANDELEKSSVNNELLEIKKINFFMNVFKKIKQLLK